MESDLRDIGAFTPGDRARVGSRLALDCGRAGCSVGGKPRCVSPSHLSDEQNRTFLAALKADAAGLKPEAPAPAAKTPQPPAAVGAVDPAASTLWALVEPAARAAIQALVEVEAAKRAVTVTHVFKAPDKDEVRVDGAHEALPRLVKRIRAGIPTMMVGPAGCGKSRLAEAAARVVGRTFFEVSFCEQTTVGDLLGRYMPSGDGTWKYFPSPFVRGYTEGGLVLLDEMDRASPGVLLALNGALASDRLLIPATGETLKRHPEAIIVGAANTAGNGADRIYTTANGLDGSSVDRFRAGRFRVGYDRALEERLIDPKVLAWMRDLREHVTANNVREVVSTRFGCDATALLRQGVEWREIREEYLAFWSKDAIAKLPASLR